MIGSFSIIDYLNQSADKKRWHQSVVTNLLTHFWDTGLIFWGKIIANIYKITKSKTPLTTEQYWKGFFGPSGCFDYGICNLPFWTCVRFIVYPTLVTTQGSVYFIISKIIEEDNIFEKGLKHICFDSALQLCYWSDVCVLIKISHVYLHLQCNIP